MGRNILIGKMGRSIHFNSDNWGAQGGDNEAPVLYRNLIHMNPDDTFYMLGRSDLSRLPHAQFDELNKHGNLIDMWGDWKPFKKSWTGQEGSGYKEIAYIREKEKELNVNFDCGVYFSGLAGSYNVVGEVYQKKKPDTIAQVSMMVGGYSSFFVDVINRRTDIPYLMVHNDPRLFTTGIAKDIFHRPKILLSQINGIHKHRSWTSYTEYDYVYKDVRMVYSGLETIFLIGKDRDADDIQNDLGSIFTQEEPTSNFMVVLNEGNPSRYPELKKYILDNVEDVEIYGKWADKRTEGDRRFKGPRKFNDLQKKLKDAKYTFCISIANGWVTSKFWEMIHNGIVPFLHPNYDKQNNLGCPDFIRVEKPEDLFEKIQYLENNPDAYDDLWKELRSLLKDSYYSGEYQNKVIQKAIQTFLE